MVLVLTVPHSLPFRQPLLMAVFPPDVFTCSIETSETKTFNRRTSGAFRNTPTFRLLEREPTSGVVRYSPLYIA
jgi:hypothetical protein